MARVTVTDTAPKATALAAGRMADAIAAAGAGERFTCRWRAATRPRAAYERVTELVASWDAVELWLGDERMVPPGDPQSNYCLLADTLLRRTGVRAHTPSPQMAPRRKPPAPMRARSANACQADPRASQ